jgi:dephospho-CoA kinase
VTAPAPDVPLKIGLTGGIASGKSTIADMFAELGVPVIDTDFIARELVMPGQPALDEIRQRFGDAMFTESGNLDRAAMRKAIFSDHQARQDLEAILHPRIGAETRRRSEAADGSYQVIVVPLLVESSLRSFVDRVLVVDCDVETQIQRLLARDAETREQAERILAAQTSRDERLEIADDVITNMGNLEDTRSRVIELDREYRHLSGCRSRRARSPENS